MAAEPGAGHRGGVRVGTCSWTDKTMVGVYYPKDVSTAEARLRYYAARFDTVEVDSTFYGLPQRAHAKRWAERTPDRFVFHVKAYGLMTGHAVDERSLHPELREFGYARSGGRVKHPPKEMVDAAFAIFRRELEPLVDAGKMGGVLMQFPPYFTATEPARHTANLEYIEYAQDALGDMRMLVEFRHPSWVADEGAREQTLRFLADRGLAYVCVDAPQFENASTMPPLAAVTAPLSYVRLHGRNRDTYFKLTGSAADRFDYLYTPQELSEWAEPVRALAAEADETYVMFNNCKYDYAPRNAREMAEILGDLVDPREGGAPTGEVAAGGADAEAGGAAGGRRESPDAEGGPSGEQLHLGV